MSFNDETLKSQDYDLFFTLLGTEPERAFYHIYAKNLDLVKIEIILKQGMKMCILNILNIIKIFFKLLFLITMNQVNNKKPSANIHQKISFIKFIPPYNKLNVISDDVEFVAYSHTSSSTLELDSVV